MVALLVTKDQKEIEQVYIPNTAKHYVLSTARPLLPESLITSLVKQNKRRRDTQTQYVGCGIMCFESLIRSPQSILIN